jgi:myosin heavy subunit
MLRGCWPVATADADRRTSKVTLGSQFRRQLEDLMTALNTTEPHFIRCATQATYPLSRFAS